jgi:hypothetical protein
MVRRQRKNIWSLPLKRTSRQLLAHTNKPCRLCMQARLLRLIHDVEHMMQEANSGASFEQYFRWASTDELRNIMGHLRTLGLTDVAEITTDAMRVAFPNGTPSTQEAKDEATDWTPEQESELNRLFTKLEELNGRVMNILGAYARRVGA